MIICLVLIFVDFGVELIYKFNDKVGWMAVGIFRVYRSSV